MKRAFDIVASALGLLVCAPIMALIAVLVRLDSRGPALFRQERVGRNMRPFRILKFRTMVADAPGRGPGLTVGEDARITRLGRILRHTKLDELPQLINVLCGDMSLVGSRPELPRYVGMYLHEYRRVLKLRPGITDAASIAYRNESEILAGSADPEKFYVDVILPDKIRLSQGYVPQASLVHDTRLIFTTLVCLVYPGRLIEAVIERLYRHHLWVTVSMHAACVVLANVVAYGLRWDGAVPARELSRMLTALPWLLGLRLALFAPLGLYRGQWRYVSVRDAQNIFTGVTLSTLVFGLGMTRLPVFAGYSRSVMLLDWLLCVALLGGMRFARRLHEELRHERRVTRRVILVGDDAAVERVLREFVHDVRYAYQAVGIVNGDPRSRGLKIHDVPILGDYATLEDVLRGHDPDEVIVAPSSGEPGSRADLVKRCRTSGRPVKVIPSFGDVLTGREPTLRDTEVDPEELLFRETTPCDFESLRAHYRGRRVMVTGAGGSIGSEICRQLAACEPEVLVLFERHEGSMYEIERALRALAPEIRIEAVIGDVTDRTRVRDALETHRPQVVFHAAAYKHVPMMEKNPREAYRTNVGGTRIAAEAAREAGVEVFLLISTDKAVEPVSIMGMTKRLAELQLQELHQQHRGATRFLTVRFGNVLDSSGSVVPLFREQIARGGPVTVTHPAATRLFMTIPEAVNLILESPPFGEGGEVFVLDMGKPVRILDMAHALIRRSGLQPDKDIPIVFIGMRPGERLFEKLFNDHETIWKTRHPRILMAVSGAAGSRGQELESLARTVLSRAGLADAAGLTTDDEALAV